MKKLIKTCDFEKRERRKKERVWHERDCIKRENETSGVIRFK